MPVNNNFEGNPIDELGIRFRKLTGAVWGRFDQLKWRLHLLGGTATVAADYALSAGWDATGTVTVTAGSTDICGQILVTAAGTPGANPTVTFTFKDGAFASAPLAFVQIATLGTLADVSKISWVTTTTTLVITYVGTPTAAHTFLINYMLIGKDAG